MTKMYQDRYGFLISIFSFATIFAQFLLHEVDVSYSISLHDTFSSIYPEESKIFLWALESQSTPNQWIIIAISTGIIAAAFHFIIMNYFSKKPENFNKIANIILFVFNLGLFVVVSQVFRPIILTRMVTLIFAIVSSLIISVSTHLFLIHDHLKEKRRNNVPNNGNSSFILKALELEHSEYKQGIHTLSWAYGFFSAGLIFATVTNYVFNLPLEITFSNTFGLFLQTITGVFTLNSVGLFIGVLYQLLWEIHDICDVIREHSNSPKLNHEKVENIQKNNENASNVE